MFCLRTQRGYTGQGSNSRPSQGPKSDALTTEPSRLIYLCHILYYTEDDHEDRLMRIMMSQSKFRRPVLSSKDNVTVHFGITLHQIVDVVSDNIVRYLLPITKQRF